MPTRRSRRARTKAASRATEEKRKAAPTGAPARGAPGARHRERAARACSRAEERRRREDARPAPARRPRSVAEPPTPVPPAADLTGNGPGRAARLSVARRFSSRCLPRWLSRSWWFFRSPRAPRAVARRHPRLRPGTRRGERVRRSRQGSPRRPRPPHARMSFARGTASGRSSIPSARRDGEARAGAIFFPARGPSTTWGIPT